MLRPHSSAISTGAFYNNGPIQLGIAYEFHDKIRGTPTEPLSDRAFSVAGAYQFEAVRIGAVYERLNYDATPTTHLKRNLYGVGATIDVGPGLLYAYVGRAGERHGERGGRHAHRRPHQRREHRLDAMGSELHLPAFGAHAGVRAVT